MLLLLLRSTTPSVPSNIFDGVASLLEPLADINDEYAAAFEESPIYTSSGLHDWLSGQQASIEPVVIL